MVPTHVTTIIIITYHHCYNQMISILYVPNSQNYNHNHIVTYLQLLILYMLYIIIVICYIVIYHHYYNISLLNYKYIYTYHCYSHLYYYSLSSTISPILFCSHAPQPRHAAPRSECSGWPNAMHPQRSPRPASGDERPGPFRGPGDRGDFHGTATEMLKKAG